MSPENILPRRRQRPDTCRPCGRSRVQRSGVYVCRECDRSACPNCDAAQTPYAVVCRECGTLLPAHTPKTRRRT